MPSAAVGSTDLFKILTFNVRRDGWFSRGVNTWPIRQQLISRVIRESGAVVVGVQELLPQMRDDVQHSLCGYSIFGLGRIGGPLGEHSDILIKDDDTEVLRHETFWLSKHPDVCATRAYYSFFPRICTVGEIRFRSTGRSVRVFNTHFDHVCAPARVLGVWTILRRLQKMQQQSPMPSIIMGDLNAGPDSAAIRLMRDNLHGLEGVHLTDAYASCHPGGPDPRANTYHGFGSAEGKRRLDYIFVSDGLEVVDCAVDRTSDNGRYPSDHYPLLATLRFAEKCDKKL